MAKKKSPQRGRPPKEPSAKQSSRLVIKLTDAERAKIDAAGGQKVSAWARDVLLREADLVGRRPGGKK